MIQFPNLGVTSTYFPDDGGRFSRWLSRLGLWLFCGFLFVGCATTLTPVERDAMIKEYEAWESRIGFYAPIAQASYRDSTVPVPAGYERTLVEHIPNAPVGTSTAYVFGTDEMARSHVIGIEGTRDWNDVEIDMKALPREDSVLNIRVHPGFAAMRSEVEKGKFPGAVGLIARKGRVAYFESFGFRDKATGAPMTKDAIFRIYSMTKPLASVGAMMLMEEGRLVLTDAVSKFLPPLAKLQVSTSKFDPNSGKVIYTMVPADREMTIQHLLRHTSGLVYGEITVNAPVKEAYIKAGVYQPDGLPFDSRGMTPTEQVERLAKAPLAHQPGTVWEYSLSTDVLGRVVEAASKTTLGRFLEARVFRPLKMTDTGFFVEKDKLGRVGEALPDWPIKLLDVTTPPKNDSGGAVGVSTAADYLRFCQMLLNGGQLDSARVLSRSTVSLMTSDHLAKITVGVTPTPTPGELLLGTPGYTFGLGFAVQQGAGVAAMPGSAGEYMWAGFGGTYFWIDPKEELIGILMTQAPSPERAYYRKLFKQLVYQAIVE